MKRIFFAVQEMDLEELREVLKDIENNNEILKKAVWQRMQELSNSDKFCATCFRELKNPKFTLIIGDKLKRKLSFCESDCFNYYIKNIEDLKEEAIQR